MCNGTKYHIERQLLSKPRPPKTMNPLTYTIVRGNRDYPEQFQEVKGFVMFELYGYQWATHQDIPAGNWIVSEVSTGFELESGRVFFEVQEAKDWALSYLLYKGEAMVRFHVEKARMKIQQYEHNEANHG